MTKRLLLTRHNRVVGVFYRYSDAAIAAGFRVDDNGQVTCLEGREYHPTYIVDWAGKNKNAFHCPSEVLADFARNHWPETTGLRLYRLAD